MCHELLFFSTKESLRERTVFIKLEILFKTGIILKFLWVFSIVAFFGDFDRKMLF